MGFTLSGYNRHREARRFIRLTIEHQGGNKTVRDDYNSTVTQRTEVNPDLIVLRVRADGSLFPFKAGQV
jgi:hypothetical protein